METNKNFYPGVQVGKITIIGLECFLLRFSEFHVKEDSGMPVLAAYNNTAQGLKAVWVAAREARLRGCDLIVVCLDPFTSHPESGKDLKNVLQQLDDVKVADIIYRIDDQEPAKAIMDQALAWQVDLIVIGARTRETVGKFMIGSTTKQLLLDSSIPVMVVRSDAHDGELVAS